LLYINANPDGKSSIPVGTKKIILIQEVNCIETHHPAWLCQSASI